MFRLPWDHCKCVFHVYSIVLPARHRQFHLDAALKALPAGAVTCDVWAAHAPVATSCRRCHRFSHLYQSPERVEHRLEEAESFRLSKLFRDGLGQRLLLLLLFLLLLLLLIEEEGLEVLLLLLVKMGLVVLLLLWLGSWVEVVRDGNGDLKKKRRGRKR